MVCGGNLYNTHLKCLFFYSDGLSLYQVNFSQVHIFLPYCAMYDCFQNIVPWNHQICYRVQARQVPSLTPPWRGMGKLTRWVWQFCEKTTNEILLKIKENGISFRKFISIYINVRGEADCIEKYTCTDRWRNNTTVERKSEKVSLFLFLRSLHEIFLPEKCFFLQAETSFQPERVCFSLTWFS